MFHDYEATFAGNVVKAITTNNITCLHAYNTLEKSVHLGKHKTFNIIGFTYSRNDQTNGQCLAKCVLRELRYFMVHIYSNCNTFGKGCKATV